MQFIVHEIILKVLPHHYMMEAEQQSFLYISVKYANNFTLISFFIQTPLSDPVNNLINMIFMGLHTFGVVHSSIIS